MASDSAAEARNFRSKAQSSGFKWVSSSPSPSEVARLESIFPDVVRLPVSSLEEEAAGWQRNAVLARSFSKWVPADAYIREFRRAGISGDIVPVSLAFRCHIFRFEDPKAVDVILNRPWVINGQIIGTEAWRQDFFPAENSISSALVWMRMPGLPMEFWKEEFLSAISEQAGSFNCVDAATASRTRGGFARVAVRVNLCHPLRPGTRIQGLNGIFWQSFAYESLEGFCPKCGSLHLEGSCISVDLAEAEGSVDHSVFGPWLAAVRQRRIAEVPRVQPLPSVSAPSSVAEDLSLKDGWKRPLKISRRRPLVPVKSASACSVPEGKPLCPGLAGELVTNPLDVQVLRDEEGLNVSVERTQAMDKEESLLNSSSLVAVPVFQQRAGSRNSAKGKMKLDLGGLSDDGSEHPLVSANPFASLALASSMEGQVENRVMGPGPLKRARPVECLPPRSIPKSDKRKGKGKGKLGVSRGSLCLSLPILPQSHCCPDLDQEVSMSNPDRPTERECQDTSVVLRDQGSGDIVVDPDVMQDCSCHNSDNVMAEDQEKVLATSS